MTSPPAPAPIARPHEPGSLFAEKNPRRARPFLVEPRVLFGPCRRDLPELPDLLGLSTSLVETRTMRCSSRFVLLFAAVLILSTASVASGQPGVVVAKPGSYVARDLLEGLDPALESERRTAVESALAAYPGSAEVLVLALLDKSSQDFLWANPGRALAPWDPGAAGMTYAGRTLMVERLPDGALPGATVTIDKARYVPARTGVVSRPHLSERSSGGDVSSRYQRLHCADQRYAQGRPPPVSARHCQRREHARLFSGRV